MRKALTTDTQRTPRQTLDPLCFLGASVVEFIWNGPNKGNVGIRFRIESFAVVGAAFSRDGVPVAPGSR